ncbi:MAG TPA: aminoacyl-tRNA hydrolase [Anaerolineae bacterium]|nr:aminoacyl-tRNA hydrolase [Anaerolineae bacterium]
MIEISDNISLHEGELSFDFIRASGPGGQNVNKVATAVQLRFDVCNSPSLPDRVKKRLTRLAGRRMTAAGVLVIDARRCRTQEANREEALQRLVKLIRKAMQVPKRRKPTRSTRAAREKRLAVKRRRSKIKRSRQSSSLDSD